METGIIGNKHYDVNTPYRELMCDMLTQAIKNAQGLELSGETNSYKKCRHDVKQNAIAYILSDDLAEDMDAFGMPDGAVERVRMMVTQQTHQLPLQRRDKYAPKLTPEQRGDIREGFAASERRSTLAREYRVNYSSVNELVMA